MNASTEPVRDEQERRDLFAAYLNLPQLHRWGFDEILKRPLVLGCLRNSLEAMRPAARQAQGPVRPGDRRLPAHAVIRTALMFLVRCVKTCNLRRRYAYTWGLAWQKAAE